MRDPRVLFRKVSISLPISISDLLVQEIKQLGKKSTQLTILDLGAGSANYWAYVQKKFPVIQLELDLMDPAIIEGSACPLTNVSQSRIRGNIPKDLTAIPDDASDFVVAFDLIEHLPKDTGVLFLYELDRISSSISVVFTPNGFTWQPPSVNNLFNAHLSGWELRALRNLGWEKIRWHTDFQGLHGPYGMHKDWVKGWTLLGLGALLQILAWKAPGYVFAFSATKQTKNPRILEQDFL
jgi:hypothetical protein